MAVGSPDASIDGGQSTPKSSAAELLGFWGDQFSSSIVGKQPGITPSLAACGGLRMHLHIFRFVVSSKLLRKNRQPIGQRDSSAW